MWFVSNTCFPSGVLKFETWSAPSCPRYPGYWAFLVDISHVLSQLCCRNSGSPLWLHQERTCSDFLQTLPHAPDFAPCTFALGQFCFVSFYSKKSSPGKFPGGPVIRTPWFRGRGHGFSPWSGNKDPTCCMVQPKTKTQTKSCLE